MARFIAGLNTPIADAVDLHHCVDLEEMVHMAVKIEQRLKRRGFTWQNPNTSTSTCGSNTPTMDDVCFSQQPKVVENKIDSDKAKPSGKFDPSTSRTRDIECFKCHGRGHKASECPNRKEMVIRANGDVESESGDEQDYSDILELEEVPEVVKPVKGNVLSLVSHRILNIEPKLVDHEQRENIFHTRCLVKDKVCSMIIDGGSCTNVASAKLVEKLEIPTLEHPEPHTLQWFNDYGEVRVNKRVLVSFQIGGYEDDILCDVVPMRACHIFLG
ncbi:hypothetical protein DH2020_012812 [Rehmannia glutinosa]|uniref:CCHC-type domain-containing protein n=1 Tax=Rehmannia glutinosa TaxID=99300 RepID=A0ABR0X0F9_REHGL